MPSRNFDKFLTDNKLIHTEKLYFLNGFKVGIDASVWLRSAQKIITSQNNKINAYMNTPTLPGVERGSGHDKENIPTQGEPFQQAMGGVPLTLRSLLENNLKILQGYNITPYFVFNGLGLIKSDQPFTNLSSKKFSNKNLVWNDYYAGKFESCFDQWKTSANYTGIDVINMMIRVLFENKVDYLRAPFLAAPQLIYLELAKFVTYIYCNPEVLVYEAGGLGTRERVERVITGMDFEKGTFDWIDKSEILEKCGLENQQLLDAYILAGFDQYPTFSPFNSASPFETACEKVSMLGNALSVIQENKNRQMTTTVEFYFKASAIFRCHPVINEQCLMEPIDSEIDFPYDLGEIFGPRFKDSIYFFLSQGLISPQVLNNVTSKLILEFPPACQGETSQYREMLQSVIQMRCDTLGLLAAVLGETYDVQVLTYYWFDPENSIPMEINNNLSQLFLNWNIPMGITIQYGRVDILSSLRLINNPKARELSFSHEESLYHSEIHQVLYLVNLQILEAREFLNPDHSLSSFGEVLLKAHPEHQEELFLAIELLRFQALNGYSYNFLDGQKNRDSSPVLLLTRVFSMIHPRFVGLPWSGIVDLELLCFNSVLKTLVRSLRNLTEMTVLHSYMTEQCIMDIEGFPKDSLILKKIYFSLPFGHENNCALGLVLKYHLQHFRDEGYNTSILKEKFPACLDALDDLKRGTNFWENVCRAAKVMAESGLIQQEIHDQFLEADALLNKSLKIL